MKANDSSEQTHAEPKNDLRLITCIVQRGKGDRIGKAGIEAGASGVTVFFARGMGMRERLGLLGMAIVPEKEVVMVICSAKDEPHIFDAMVKAGKVNVPGMGVAFVTPILEVVGIHQAIQNDAKQD
ncbi:MAG: P-II family nitrogen regulator [Verrucomicrobia bacterium]|nr:P-II family nitrogen regulator [Verrucomicrobiota bacterium]